MEIKNNKQYEWFKGPQATRESKNWKQHTKEGFKWAKIFSYVALFTFSMFGCVQVFTVGTENSVGQGLEIFHDDADIAPTVSTTTFAKGFTYGPSAGVGTEVEARRNVEFYSFSTTPVSSIWINKNSDAETLKSVHSFVEEVQDVEMKAAYKGVNSGIKDYASAVTKWDYTDADGNPYEVIASSVAEDIFGITGTDQTELEKKVEEFNNEKISKHNENDNPIVYSSAAENFNLNETATQPDEIDIDFWIPIQSSYEWDAVNEAYKPVYDAFNIVIDSNDFDQDDKKFARAAMAENFLTHYLGNNFDSTLFNYLGSKTKDGAIQLAEEGLYLDTSGDDAVYENPSHDPVYQGIFSGRYIMNSVLLSAAGFDYDTSSMKYTGGELDGKTYTGAVLVNSITYDEGSMVGYIGENTKWRPITTWGESFSLGPFYGFFVYPIGYITSNIIGGMGNMNGWESIMTIFLVVFSIRMLTFALSYKSTMAQSKMQDLNSKKAIIEAKYVQYEGNRQMEMRKRQEVADLYKKNGINPMASLGTMFLTMPFFLAIWRVIGGIPHLKAASWLGITFSATSWREMFAGGWQYLPLIIVAASIQLLSQLYPRLINRKRDKERLNAAQKEAMKKANKTQNITMGVFVFMSVIFTAGIQIYWIIGGLWRILEVRITHNLKERHRKRNL